MNLIKLLQLAKDNEGQRHTLRVEASNDDEATIYVYGAIGGWYGDIDAQNLASQLAGVKAKTIHLRVNSPGGDVFEARAMMTALRSQDAKVVAHIDGLAASAATFLVMAADEVEISQGGFFMIHNAWTVAMGNKAELLATADLLDKIDASIKADYASRSSATAEQITTWMDAETWMTADEAVTNGFVDRVFEVAGKGKKDARWNLAAYANVPAALAAPATSTDTNDGLDEAEIAAFRAQLERRLSLLEAVPA